MYCIAMEKDSASSVEELKEKTRTVLAKLERLALETNVPEDSGRVTAGRTRVRTRKNKHKDDSGGGPLRPAVQSTDPIDHGMQFVLEILRLPQANWTKHIAELAINKGVIVPLPHVGKGQSARYAWNKDHGENEHTTSLVAQLNGARAATGHSESSVSSHRERERKKRRYLNLDETINELIVDSKLHVSLSPHKFRSEAELDKALKRIADMLEAAGLGYVDEGELFVTKQGSTAFVRTEPEVVIRKPKLRRCALNGDMVRVFVFTHPAKQSGGGGADSEREEDGEDVDADAVEELMAKCSATGFVVKVLKQVHQRSCVGQFGGSPTAKTGTLLFYPHSRGIPPVNVASRHLDAFIPKGTAPEDYFKELPQRLFEVELTGNNSFYGVCTGRVLSDVGIKGNIVDENACILLRHGFKTHCIDRLERLGESCVAKAAAKEPVDAQGAVVEAERRDLTHMCIFTIDPATARDLDDAVSCRQLENGNYEVGVHISDVTQYVGEDTELDRLVREAKTTSVYMVDRVYHMLPPGLCQTCSLLPGERKQTVSVFVELTPRAEVVTTSFARSEINSCCQMSYEQAQRVIDDEDPLAVAPLTIYNGFEATDLRTTIKALHALALVMRERRMRNGALKFDKPKYHFRLDEQNQPIELLAEASKPANHLIEEFMILANQLVGEHIYARYPQWAILRQHSPPKLDQMAKVRAFFRDLEFPDLNYRTATEINASMAAILAECDRRQLDRAGFEMVLNGLLAKPMNRAQYFCTGDDRYADRFDHFALSIPFYTHFTSPIRRYPDILVHRLLIRAINDQPAPVSWHLAELNDLMGDCNRQKMNAKYASEDSARLFLVHYLRTHFPQGKEMKATVCCVLQRSLEVKLWETGDELNVAHADIEASGGMTVERRDDGIRVVVKDAQGAITAEAELKIFSTCRVCVTVDRERLKASLLVG